MLVEVVLCDGKHGISIKYSLNVNILLKDFTIGSLGPFEVFINKNGEELQADHQINGKKKTKNIDEFHKLYIIASSQFIHHPKFTEAIKDIDYTWVIIMNPLISQYYLNGTKLYKVKPCSTIVNALHNAPEWPIQIHHKYKNNKSEIDEIVDNEYQNRPKHIARRSIDTNKGSRKVSVSNDKSDNVSVLNYISDDASGPNNNEKLSKNDEKINETNEISDDEKNDILIQNKKVKTKILQNMDKPIFNPYHIVDDVLNLEHKMKKGLEHIRYSLENYVKNSDPNLQQYCYNYQGWRKSDIINYSQIVYDEAPRVRIIFKDYNCKQIVLNNPKNVDDIFAQFYNIMGWKARSFMILRYEPSLFKYCQTYIYERQHYKVPLITLCKEKIYNYNDNELDFHYENHAKKNKVIEKVDEYYK